MTVCDGAHSRTDILLNLTLVFNSESLHLCKPFLHLSDCERQDEFVSPQVDLNIVNTVLVYIHTFRVTAYLHKADGSKRTNYSVIVGSHLIGATGDPDVYILCCSIAKLLRCFVMCQLANRLPCGKEKAFLEGVSRWNDLTLAHNVVDNSVGVSMAV